MYCRAGAAHIVTQLIVIIDCRARQDFSCFVSRHLWHRQNFARDADAAQQWLEVRILAQKCIVDQRRLVWIVTLQRDAAAALWPQQNGVDTETVAYRKWEAWCRPCCGHEYKLHIGAIEPFGSAQKSGDLEQ